MAYPCFDTHIDRRDVAGENPPSKRRASRQVVASIHRMVNTLHRFEDALKVSPACFLQIEGAYVKATRTIGAVRHGGRLTAAVDTGLLKLEP
jgi:hypothetical protein